MGSPGFLVALILFLSASPGLLLPAAARPATPQPAIERELEAQIATAVGRRFDVELRPDSGLAEAARDLAFVHACGLDVQAHEFLRQAQSRQGILDPFPYVVHGSAPRGRASEIAQQCLAHLERVPARERSLYTHVAAGVVQVARRRGVFFQEHTEHVVLVLTQRALTYTPFETDVRPGDRLVFEGDVHRPFREPQVLLTAPDGGVSTLADLGGDRTSFRTWIAFDRGPGEYQIEVVARDDMGPRVLGLASLHALPTGGAATPHERLVAAARAGSLEPRRDVRPKPVPATESAAEERMLELLNRDRRRAGLAALLPDPTLAAMARAHSRDMLDHGFFAHVSPHTGRLAERAAVAGLRYERLAENLAIHRDVDAAEAALLRSPGHRVHILDPRFTHVGIGVALATDIDGTPRLYVTQEFMTAP